MSQDPTLPATPPAAGQRPAVTKPLNGAVLFAAQGLVLLVTTVVAGVLSGANITGSGADNAAAQAVMAGLAVVLFAATIASLLASAVLGLRRR